VQNSQPSWQGGMYIWGTDDVYGGDEQEVENTHWVTANFKKAKKASPQEERSQSQIS